MVARYKRRQLGVSGWNPERKALGFFGHVTWQASGWREGVAGERAELNASTPSYSKKASSGRQHRLQKPADVFDFLRVQAVRHGVGVPLHGVAERGK